MANNDNNDNNDINILTEELNAKLEEIEGLKKRNAKLEDDFLSARDKLDFAYNEYQKMLGSLSWRCTKPFRKIKNACKRLYKKIIMSKDKKQSILFLAQSWLEVYDINNTNIGGTTIHVIDIINKLKYEKNCYVLTIINNKYMLVTFEKDTQKIYDLNLKVKTFKYDQYDYEFLEMMNMLIENLHIDLLHIHHLSGFPCDIEFVAKNIKTIYTVHDYFLVCPNFFLLKENTNICQKDSQKTCEKCLFHSSIDLITRKNAIQNFINCIDEFIFPDESIKYELEKYFDIKNSTILPHGMDTTKYKIENKNTNTLNRQNINIAFVGFINKHKGLQIIKDLILNNQNDNITFHLFGESMDPSLNQNHPNYIFHGKYNKYDLPGLLIENNIQYVFLLSTCLETYSYVLSEVSLANIPVVAFDLGAIGNRIKKDDIGWVIPYNENTDYKDITNKYNTIFDTKNYNEKVNNIEKLKLLTIEDMVKEVQNIYDKCYNNSNLKDYYKIYRFLNQFYLKYEIKLEEN